jgi:hypothetical protein
MREVGDDVFLIDQQTQSIHHLNETGAALWRLMADPIELREIVAVFGEAFPQKSRRLLKKSLKRILVDLDENGLLTAPE